MIQDFFIPFVALLFAELGDKTQIAVFCLSTKTKKYLALFLGVMLAFLVADGLAILFGEFIVKVIPELWIKIVAGGAFIVFGVITFFQKADDKCDVQLKNPFFSAFGLILVSEMGDKTQIASGLFATQYSPLWVLLGVLASLAILSAGAIICGNVIIKKCNKKYLAIFSGILFIIIGIWMFF